MRLYHNPRCSKSRQAVALLEARGVVFEEVRYLAEGIREEDLDLLAALDGIVRVKDVPDGRTVDVSDISQVRALLASEPKVLERPVLIYEGKAAVGRPPERLLELLPR